MPAGDFDIHPRLPAIENNQHKTIVFRLDASSNCGIVIRCILGKNNYNKDTI